MQNTRKGFSLPTVIGIVALALIIFGSFYYAASMRETAEAEKEIVTPDNTTENEMTKKAVEESSSEATPVGTGLPDATEGEKTVLPSEVEGEDGGETLAEIMFTGKVLAGTTDKLLDFNQSDYEKALASDKLVMLYFYANWCPICKVEFARTEQAFDELTGGKVVGFRVNYNDSQTNDDEKNLARVFGVSYQHTKVFLQNGQRVLKSPESWNKDRYLQEINKFINNSQ